MLQNKAENKKKKKKKELKATTTDIYSGRGFRNPKGATEVVRRFRKKAAGFSRKNNWGTKKGRREGKRKRSWIFYEYCKTVF